MKINTNQQDGLNSEIFILKEEKTTILQIPKMILCLVSTKALKKMIFSENDSNLLKNDLTKEADRYTFLKDLETQK